LRSYVLLTAINTPEVSRLKVKLVEVALTQI